MFGSDLVIGWYGEQPKAVARVQAFYDGHWPYYETDQRGLSYPGYPVQGDWRIDGIGLPADVLAKVYEGNARRLIPALRR